MDHDGSQMRRRSRAAPDHLAGLLRCIANDDKSAFAQLYGLTSRKLYGVALRIVRDRSAADDLLQEAYLKIWRRAGSYDPALASPIAWMVAIIRNGAIDIMRKQQLVTTEDGSEMLALPSDDADPVQELDMSRKRALAFAVFRDMCPEKRRMVILAYLRSENREQIARRYGIPVNTVKTHLRRALLDINAEVRRRLETGERAAA
ncbi:MAG: sigma-70 family RNA polymerase sigma factor [Pseudomonadota bacterium]